MRHRSRRVGEFVRAMLARLYERRLEDLPDPVVPAPRARRAATGAGTGAGADANGSAAPGRPKPPEEAPVP